MIYDYTLTVVGLSIIGPLVGSVVGVLKRPGKVLMKSMLAFAAGVMLSISFIKLIPESIMNAPVPVVVAFFLLGALFMSILDNILPHVHPSAGDDPECKLRNSAYILIIGIFIHNFPEGMAIALSAQKSLSSSIAVAMAIALHDIPEGICTSAPYYYCTGKRLKAFLVSSLTSLPVLAGFFTVRLFMPDMSAIAYGAVLSATAGIMLYISFDELLPASRGKDKKFGRELIIPLAAGAILVLLLGV